MSILILGSNGSMGQRYKSILRFLHRPYVGLDVGYTDEAFKSAAMRAEGVIIATPTDTHAKLIRDLLPFKKPILCEKPVTKDIVELKSLIQDIRLSGTSFRMMLQYELLCDDFRIGPSRYNYFKHGNDGLYWDCIQIIGLSRSTIQIEESSPIWRCMINGKALKIGDMDSAYVGYVQLWLRCPDQSLDKILEFHEKTHDMAVKNG